MRLLLTAALVVVAALPLAAQTAVTSASAGGTASVKILPADVTIVHDATRTLEFGIIKASEAPQTKTIAPYSGQDDLFNFTKDAWEEVTTSVSPTVSFTGTTMTATLGSRSDGYEGGGHTWNTAGTVRVFGTLTVPAWTPKNNYRADYNVTVAYK